MPNTSRGSIKNREVNILPSVRSEWKSITAGIIVAIIFGLSFIATKTALHHLDAIELLALRFSLAAAGLILIVGLGWVKVNLSGRRWLKLIPLTLFQPIAYFICETFGVKLTSPTESGMIIGSIPVIVAFLAAFVLKEYPTKVQSIFILCSFIGVAVIVAGSGLSGGNHLAGVILLLGAALSAGLYNVLSRRHSQKFTSVEITLVMMIVAALSFNGTSLIRNAAQWWTAYCLIIQGPVGFPVIYLAIFSSILAFFLLNYTLSRVEAARAAAYINLTTLVSILAGVFLYGDRLNLSQAIGGAFILLGVWGANHCQRKETTDAKEVHR